NTALSHIPKPTGYADLRNIAVSRLMLDNFEHIKAYWIMLSPSVAQIALRFGANDLDGTVVEEKIYHDAGAKTSEFTPRSELERLIRAAGRVPVERDTLYHPVDRSKMPPLPPPARTDLVSLTLNVSGRGRHPFVEGRWTRGSSRFGSLVQRIVGAFLAAFSKTSG